MRDPNLIKPILAVLEEAWMKYPDLRLCQLIAVAASYGRVVGPSPIFYIEDDVILAGIEKVKVQ